MAKYMLLIHGDQQKWDDISAEERHRITEGHRRFMDVAGAAVVGGHELASAGTSTTLRSRGGGQPDVTDGPFLETKEALGGFYVIEVADLDEAIRLGSLLPETAPSYSAGVEIRPVIEPD